MEQEHVLDQHQMIVELVCTAFPAYNLSEDSKHPPVVALSLAVEAQEDSPWRTREALNKRLVVDMLTHMPAE